MDTSKHEDKLARLQDAHMAPLMAYRDDLIHRTRKVIPHFDPEDGGTQAELLLLLTRVDGDPGSARNGSSFISTENEDPTATNLRKVIEAVGLNRKNLLIWNVVPWQDGHPTKDAEHGAMHLPRLVRLLPHLRGIAVLGKEGRAVKAVQEELAGVRGLEWVQTFSPAPRAYNNHAAPLTQDLRHIARKLSLI